MDHEILKKKVSTFRGEGGRVSISDDHLLLEILEAWEQWTGPASGFYSAIGVSAKGISSIIGRAKRLKRDGFPTAGFKEIQLQTPAAAGFGPCLGIELGLTDGRIIRFPQVDSLVEFLKKAA
jgi:hypothetical protein